MVRNNSKVLKEHTKRLSDLEEKDRIETAVTAGIEAYKKQQKDLGREQLEEKVQRTKLKVLIDLSPLIVAATALAYAIITNVTP